MNHKSEGDSEKRRASRRGNARHWFLLLTTGFVVGWIKLYPQTQTQTFAQKRQNVLVWKSGFLLICLMANYFSLFSLNPIYRFLVTARVVGSYNKDHIPQRTRANERFYVSDSSQLFLLGRISEGINRHPPPINVFIFSSCSNAFRSFSR